MMIRYCLYTVAEGIHLTITRGKNFDGVLELLFFTDSDHGGNADGSSNSGMMAYLCNNYFHGYSSGQRCLTLNTAESEYIAMVKCLQFAIWTMLLLREMGFRVRFPIPILADNVAAILIAKSPTHTKYARHISLRTHYIRSILPFRDFILAFIGSRWNFADLNTKAAAPIIFQQLTPFVLMGLHTFNWAGEVTGTLNDIWQQTEARENAKELQQHTKDFDNSRKRQRAKETTKEVQLEGGAENAEDTRARLVATNRQRREPTTTSGGVSTVTFKVSFNGHDNEVVVRDPRKKDKNKRKRQ